MSRRRAGVAVLGGTFDRLHAGHRVLLARAFELADEVGIGVTTDRYLARHSKPLAIRIQPYQLRRQRLRAYVRRTFPHRPFWLAPLDDTFGRSVEPGVDVLVASAESRVGARSVNRERARRHLPPLELAFVPLVRAEDGLPVSSRRVRAGRIDPEGVRTAALDVLLVGSLPIGIVRDAFVRAFPSFPAPRVHRGRAPRKRPGRSGSSPTRVGPDFTLLARATAPGLRLTIESSVGSWSRSIADEGRVSAALDRLLQRAAPG